MCSVVVDADVNPAYPSRPGGVDNRGWGEEEPLLLVDTIDFLWIYTSRLPEGLSTPTVGAQTLTTFCFVPLASLNLVLACDAVSAAAQPGQPWYSSILIGAVAGVSVAITLGFLRWLNRVTLLHHDRSALAFLGRSLVFEGRELDMVYFGNVPIYRDNQRYYQVKSDVLTNNDPMDIVGFVVGSPRFLKDPPHNGPSGYYVYLVINWNYSDHFKRWVKMGCTIQLSGTSTAEGDVDTSRPDTRHLVISPFGTCGRRVIDICEGPRYSLRWQPYKKWGFTPDDLPYRALSWQSKLISKLAIVTGRLVNCLKPKH